MNPFRSHVHLFVAAVVACSIWNAPSLFSQEEPPAPKNANAIFADADKKLNRAWDAVKARLSAPNFARLKELQLAWIGHRDSIARSPIYHGFGEGELPLTSPHYLATAAQMTLERVQWLEKIPGDDNSIASMTGRWSDGVGGTLDLVEDVSSGRMLFVLEVVRGPSVHSGSLAGVAEWNSPIAWFSDKDRGNDETASLAFVVRDPFLEVIGANTSYYHGARAYFDGFYVKIGELTARQVEQTQSWAEAGEITDDTVQ